MKTIYGKLHLQGDEDLTGTGWLPPMPDLRDYTEYNEEISAISQKPGIGKGRIKAPTSVAEFTPKNEGRRLKI